jgi:hypothetical protein
VHNATDIFCWELLMANAAQSVDVLPHPKPKRVFLIARGPQALAIPALYFSYKIAIGNRRGFSSRKPALRLSRLYRVEVKML